MPVTPGDFVEALQEGNLLPATLSALATINEHLQDIEEIAYATRNPTAAFAVAAAGPHVLHRQATRLLLRPNKIGVELSLHGCVVCAAGAQCHAIRTTSSSRSAS
jgi:hypothetical protein